MLHTPAALPSGWEGILWGPIPTAIIFYAQVCAQHMKTIPWWCTFMLLLGFVIVDTSVANMHPRVKCLKSKVQCQSYLLCNLVYRGLYKGYTNEHSHPQVSEFLSPIPLSVFVFLVHLKKKKGEKEQGGGQKKALSETVSWTSFPQQMWPDLFMGHNPASDKCHWRQRHTPGYFNTPSLFNWFST